MLNLKITQDGDQDLAATLSADKRGNIYSTIPNFLAIMERDVAINSTFGFNEVIGAPVNLTNGLRWSDVDDSVIKGYIQNAYGMLPNNAYNDAFNIACYRRSYNPIKRLIEKVKWDGNFRIATILQKYLKCEDTPYTKEIARLIFAGGIARLYQPGIKFDFMPIFKGAQGCGKSTFIRWLAIKDEFFKEVNQIDGKEGSEALSGGWICEMSELLALTKSKEVEAVKSFITRQNDNYRAPYTKYPVDNLRKCIMVGTTNKNQFLTDKTGNRRFLPIETHSNGFELLEVEKEARADILQAWAEAKHNYDTGNFSLVTDQTILRTVQERQADAVEDDWRVGVIENYLDGKTFEAGGTTHYSRTETCVKDIWDHALYPTVDRECKKKDSSDIVSIMDNMKGWARVTSIRFQNYGTQRGWRRITNDKQDSQEQKENTNWKPIGISSED